MQFMKVFVQRLMEKSPLRYTLTRNMGCLDPREMAKGKDLCVPRLKRCLHELVQANRFQEEDCDQVVQ